jgi:DNA-binding SARP family transcriptional activator
MMRIAAFGPVRVFRDDSGELSLVGQQPKRLALLAYLAAARPRGPHRRDTLVALLWPELDQERARAALRQALHALRKSLGAEVVVSDGTEMIGLDDRFVRCDLWDFDSAASGEYEGALFDGLFLSDAPGFEEWLARERRRVRGVILERAWANADTALSEGRVGEAVRFTRRALSLIEFDEAALRRGMQLLADAGERASAIDILERFSATLRAELDIEPSAETLTLANELRRSAPVARPRVERRTQSIPLAPVRRRRRFALAATLSVIAIAAGL